MGLMEGDANSPTIEEMTHTEEVRGSDAYGRSLIDAFGLGSDYMAVMTAWEWRASVISAAYPWAPAFGRMGVIGQSYFDLAQPLVFSAIAGTPAQLKTGPQSISALKALLSPNWRIRILFGPTLRKIPLSFALFPYTLNSAVQWFSTT